MTLDEDFKFRDDIKIKDKETVPIELLGDPYGGVVYRYTYVTIKEEVNTARVIFNYELLEMGDHTETSLRKDERFQRHIGLILNELILDSVDAEGMDERGTDDTKEPTKK